MNRSQPCDVLRPQDLGDGRLALAVASRQHSLRGAVALMVLSDGELLGDSELGLAAAGEAVGCFARLGPRGGARARRLLERRGRGASGMRRSKGYAHIGLFGPAGLVSFVPFALLVPKDTGCCSNYVGGW